MCLPGVSSAESGSLSNVNSRREARQRRDALLLKLLKTPPQPRPKRKRAGKKSGGPKDRRQSKGARS